MRIQIIIDTFMTQKHADAFRVQDQNDYLHACNSIDKTLFGNDGICVSVHNQGMKGWFDQYRNIPDVTIEVIDPISKLAESLKVSVNSIPKELQEDPRYIVFENLIEKAHKGGIANTAHIIPWILSQTIGGNWMDDNIDEPSVLADLISSLARIDLQNTSPTTIALLDSQLSQLEKHSRWGMFIHWLREGKPSRRAHHVLLARIISEYPQDAQLKALQFDGAWTNITLLPDAKSIINLIPLDSCINVSISYGYEHEIKKYFSKRLSESGIEGVLPLVSGVLDIEKQLLHNYIGEHFDRIDESWIPILESLSMKMSPSDSNREFIEWLRMIRPVQRPSLLQIDCSWENTSKWLLNEFFPYYTWANHVNQLQKTEDYVSSFEDWLLANYRSITKSRESFAPLAIKELLKSYSKNVTPMLIVLDGLPFEYGEYFQKQLAEINKTQIDLQPAITGLPTSTSFAKSSLVGGKLTDQIASGNEFNIPYSKQFAEALNHPQSEIEFGKPSQCGFQQFIFEKKKAYLYLINQIDKIAHEPYKPDLRRDKIQSLLKDLASQISDAIESFRKTHHEEIVVIITSDHGFTELPDNCKVIKLSEDLTTQIMHNRFAILSSDEMPEIDSLIYLDRNILPEFPTSLLVARGYSCIGKKPQGAVHGGITPQEVVVPVIIMDSSKKAEYLSLQVGILGGIYRGNPANPIQISITNPNKLPVTIQDMQLRLLKPLTSMPLTIDSGADITLDAIIDGSRLSQQTVKITGTISVGFCGIEQLDEINLECRTVGAALTDTAFESEFEI